MVLFPSRLKILCDKSMSRLLKRGFYMLTHNWDTPEETLKKNHDEMIKSIPKSACILQPGLFWDVTKEECRELPTKGVQRIMRPDELKRIRNDTFIIQTGGKRIPKLKKGGLRGYHVANKATERYKSLKEAIKKDGFLTD